MTYYIIKIIWLKMKIKCERHMRSAATRGHLASIYIYIAICIKGTHVPSFAPGLINLRTGPDHGEGTDPGELLKGHNSGRYSNKASRYLQLLH
jgi:hypothetical protein